MLILSQITKISFKVILNKTYHVMPWAGLKPMSAELHQPQTLLGSISFYKVV